MRGSKVWSSWKGCASFPSRLPSVKEQVYSEGQTKQSLILPFIRELGYDDGDPAEVDLEYKADMGVKGGERVDYAIMQDGKPIILIECKRKGHGLQDGDIRQLYRYFNATDARIGILTNGIEYRFFSDLEKQNIMDENPFFEFNVLNFSDTEATRLEMFSNPLNMDTVLKWARRQKSIAGIKAVLVQEFGSPSKGFVDFLKESVSQPIREQLNADLVKDALKEFVSSEAAATEPDEDDVPDLAPREKPDSVAGWHRLSEFAPEAYSSPPQRIKFSNGEERQVGNWTNLFIEVAEWLVRNGALTKDKCPVYTDTQRRQWYWVNFEPKHPNGIDFSMQHRLSNDLFLCLSGQGREIVSSCKSLMNSVGLDPSKIEMQVG